MTINSLERGFAILELISKSDGLRYTDIRDELNIPKGSLHNLISTLEAIGYIKFNESTKTYHLAPKIIALSGDYLASLNLNSILPRELSRAAKITGEIYQYAILDGTHVLYLYKEENPDSRVGISTSPGKRLPAQYTALGKAILSTMENDEVRDLFRDAQWSPITKYSVKNINEFITQIQKAREAGWAIDDEESAMGIMCIGSPVRNQRGDCKGAVSTSFVKSKYSWHEIPHIADTVSECAANISHHLGYNS